MVAPCPYIPNCALHVSKVFATMFPSTSHERKDEFLDKAKKARDERAEERKRDESATKIQVLKDYKTLCK